MPKLIFYLYIFNPGELLNAVRVYIVRRKFVNNELLAETALRLPFWQPISNRVLLFSVVLLQIRRWQNGREV